MPVRSVTRWYLEMTAPDDLAPAPPPDPDLEIRRAEIPSPELSRFLYTAVGGDWFWVDRLGWDYARWQAHVERPGVRTVGAPSGIAGGPIKVVNAPTLFVTHRAHPLHVAQALVHLSRAADLVVVLERPLDAHVARS